MPYLLLQSITMRIILFFFLILFGTCVWAQSGPLGWASLNGGTTGGDGGEVVMITNRAQLLANVTGSTPKVLMIVDTIELELYERVKVYSNKTLLGSTPQAMIRFGGLEILGNNVIIQNLAIGDFYDGDWSGTTHSTDCMTIYGVNVWVDHCWLWAGADGLLDVRSGNGSIADYITISNTKFSDHNKVTLIGSSNDDSECRDHLRVTFHHCWYDGTVDKGLNQRNPRVRFGDVHIFNNYFEEIDSYCVAARYESDVVVESNYFRNSRDAHEIEDLGLGLEDPDLLAINNLYEYCTGNQIAMGEAFTPADFYDYEPTPTWEVPALVMNEAGPFNPVDNQAPVAVDDIILYGGMTGALTISPTDNDQDADNGDLRIAQLANEPPGSATIRYNNIYYFPLPNATGIDTILYLLVDTQGGVDTGRIIIDYETVNSVEASVIKHYPVQIYPNPAHDQATLQWEALPEQAFNLKVYDSLGRVVHAENELRLNNSQYQLDIQQWPAGTYLVSMRVGATIYTRKLNVNK